jgi:hypothetical protein
MKTFIFILSTLISILLFSEASFASTYIYCRNQCGCKSLKDAACDPCVDKCLSLPIVDDPISNLFSRPRVKDKEGDSSACLESLNKQVFKGRLEIVDKTVFVSVDDKGKNYKSNRSTVGADGQHDVDNSQWIAAQLEEARHTIREQNLKPSLLNTCKSIKNEALDGLLKSLDVKPPAQEAKLPTGTST